MPQFFIEKTLSEGDEVEIRGSDAHHIAGVLRLAEGDWLILSDGQGNSFRSNILTASDRSVSARIETRVERKVGPPSPVLAIASIRSERLEWAVQKSVELGCRRILPFDSARTVRRSTSGRGSRKSDRLARIALEAAKQSGLPFLPAVDEPTDFAGLCAKLGQFGAALLFYEGESGRSLRAALAEKIGKGKSDSARSPILIVGPEGGFTDEEVALALASGAISASLGSQILRVETAAVAAMAIVQYELGNMDPA